jgi:proline dehydrogenase
MRRTIKDIQEMLALNPNLRICKGIYIEPREIAYKDDFIINQNFTYAVEKLITHKCFVAIATHDEKLVWESFRLLENYKVPKNWYEFQMLLGVDNQLRRIILGEGHPLRVYVPFGKEWYAYSTRRLQENPQIAGHIIRAHLKRLMGRPN